jgi:TorA maturation chaperone TorD
VERPDQGRAKMQLAEASRVNATRAVVYSFLSRAFKVEIDERFLRDVAEMGPTIMILSESQTGSKLKEAGRLLVEFAKQSKDLEGEKKEDLLTDLAAEYASLFLNMGPKPVHLVESVYLSRDHLLYQQSYHEIIQAYKSLGYEKEKGFREPEDHVAVEFDFMSNLCKWSSRTLDSGEIEKGITYLNLQTEFLRDHLIRWVPALCRKLEKMAASNFYKGLAYFTDGFVALDAEVPNHLAQTLKQ